MSTFKVESSSGSKSQTVIFEDIRYSGQCLSVPTLGVFVPPVNSFLLLEDSFFLLLEDGFKLVLE